MPTGIRFPLDRPAAAQGFSDTYEETRTTVEMTTGPDRVRNKMRTAPRLFNVQWKVVHADYTKFDTWWHEVIKGGALEFDVQILDDTETPVWYTVRWIKSYKVEVSSDGDSDWIISGLLRTKGASFEDRPSGTDELEGRSLFRLRARGTLFIPTVLYGRASLHLTARGMLARPEMEGRAALHFLAKGRLQTLIEDELREDGGHELREDGGRELRERP